MYTDYVSTRWYRAPELLVGDANYSKSVDVWAIGCILAEISNGIPLFPGDSDLHTLQLILKTVGNSLTDKQERSYLNNPIFEGIKVCFSLSNY
jgi:cyclin-dependent kinase-like